jgi:hypothetical protein
MNLSLGQLLDLHRLEGKGSFSVKPQGHVDLVIRNADGSVDQAASKSNLTTSLWNDNWHFTDVFSGQQPSTAYVFILPDDGDDMNPYKTAGRHLYPNNYEVSSIASINTSTKTWTWTAVFNQPSANRTFRYIGLRTRLGVQDTNGNARTAGGIYAMTKMTSDITQTSVQTLEVVYRVSFTRA